MPVKKGIYQFRYHADLGRARVHIPDVQDALRELAADGNEEVLIQPTHLLAGERV
ncbi:MAG: hypothetical protein ACLVAW_29865 [Eisenbergiella massiliensis]